MLNRFFKLAAVLAPAVFVAGCATQKSAPYDYRAFEASNPRSILVLPPLNNSPEVKATESMYSTVTYPLAEAGYYVLPVSLVNETFRQNGLTTAADIHSVDTQKLREIFGADAALYLTVEQFGSSYNVLSSVITVSASAKLVDLKTKALLWDGKVTLADNGNQGNNGGGLLGALVQAAVTQVMNNALNRSHEVGARANAMLLSAGHDRGMLYGPRSPKYTGRDAGPVAATGAAPASNKKPPARPVASSTQPKAAAIAVATAVPQPVATVAVQSAAPVVAQSVSVVPAQPPAPIAGKPVAAIAAKPAAPVAAQPVAAAAAQPVAIVSVQSVATVATQSAAAVAVEPVADEAEQRYEDALAKAQTKYQGLNPGSAWFRQDLYDWVMERKKEYIAAGKAPDVALKLALTAMEGR